MKPKKENSAKNILTSLYNVSGTVLILLSPDYLAFNIQGQSLVDAAFLAHALLRAPKQLWGNLDEATRKNLVSALKLTRSTKPGQSNWLLFSGMVEACLLQFTGECDQTRIDYAIQKHKEWYKGDGVYGDGKDFHFDYYNSFVIHPMMLDILRVTKEKGITTPMDFATELKRSVRYAEIQERTDLSRSHLSNCWAFYRLSLRRVSITWPKWHCKKLCPNMLANNR
jgi:hypothetical protein